MIILNLVITFRIYSRFNGLNPLLDEVPSFLEIANERNPECYVLGE